MGQVVRDLRRHWVGGLFFFALWAAFWGWVIVARITGVELDLAPLLIAPALPLLAGALIGWWRWQPAPASGPGADPGLGTAFAAGAGITAIHTAIMLADARQQIQASQGAAPPFGVYAWLAVSLVVVPGLAAPLIGYGCASFIRTGWAHISTRWARDGDAAPERGDLAGRSPGGGGR
jgi:hypothetical protein